MFPLKVWISHCHVKLIKGEVMMMIFLMGCYILYIYIYIYCMFLLLVVSLLWKIKGS